MASDRVQSTYGPTQIGGHATVHLGDQHISSSRVFHIATAYFGDHHNCSTCQDPLLSSPRKRKRSSIEHECQRRHTKRCRGRGVAVDQHHTDKRIPSAITPMNEEEEEDKTESVKNVNAALEQRTSSTFNEAEGLDECCHYVSKITSRSKKDPKSEAHTNIFPFISTFINRILQKQSSWQVNRPDNRVTNILKDNNQNLHQQSESSASLEYSQTMPLRDLIAAIITFLSLSLCGQPLELATSSKTQLSRRTRALLAILTYGFVRYVLMPYCSRALSDLTGDYILIEDACAQRWRVPMSHCEDFGLLKAFLEFRHHDRPGIDFIRAGQFNLMFGSRRGMVIRKDAWRKKNTVKPGSVVVLSVFINTDEARCTSCAGALLVNIMGEFHCTECRLFFRDLDTVKSFPSMPSSVAGNLDHVDQQYEVLEMQHPKPDQEDPSEELDDTDVWGLKYIDLRIIPPREHADMIRDSPLSSSDGLTDGIHHPRPSQGSNVGLPNVAENWNERQIPEIISWTKRTQSQLLRMMFALNRAQAERVNGQGRSGHLDDGLRSSNSVDTIMTSIEAWTSRRSDKSLIDT